MIKRIISCTIITALIFALVPLTGCAKLSHPFSLNGNWTDGAVVEREKAFTVKGTGAPGAKVTISLKDDSGAAVRSAKAFTDSSGRWQAELAGVAGSDDEYTLFAQCGQEVVSAEEIVFGEVWICSGQSNMALVMSKTDAREQAAAGAEASGYIRYFNYDDLSTSMEEQYSPRGSWIKCDSAGAIDACPAIPFHFAAYMREKLGVPVGVYCTAVGATEVTCWLERDEALIKLLHDDSTISETTDGKLFGGYYDTRIYPLSGVKASGILWYQGEQDQHNTALIDQALPLIIVNWRKLFGDLPFIAFDLAPYDDLTSFSDANNSINAAVGAYENGRTVPNYDLWTDLTTIHPTYKKELSERAASIALYGQKAEGPQFKSAAADIAAGTVTLSFANTAGGLRTKGGKPAAGFSILNASNGRVYPAVAEITSEDTITLRCQYPLSADDKVYYAYGIDMLTADICSGSGNMLVSSEWSLSLAQGTAEPALTASCASATSIDLNWPAADGAEGYTLCRAEDSAGEYKTIAELNKDVLSYADEGLTAAKSYYYKLYVKAAGALTQAGSAAAGTLEKTGSLMIKKLSSDSVRLTWSSINGAKEYYVYRAGREKGVYTMIASVKAGGTGVSFDDNGLVCGSTYYYTVQGVSSEEGFKIYGVLSDIAAAKAAPVSPEFTVSAAGAGTVRIDITPKADVTGYMIYQRKAGQTDYESVGRSPADSLTVTGLESGTKYEYAVYSYTLVAGKTVLSDDPSTGSIQL